MSAFGMTAAGEWSNAITDCGLWVNGVGLDTQYKGTYPGTWPTVGSCTPWTDWQNCKIWYHEARHYELRARQDGCLAGLVESYDRYL